MDIEEKRWYVLDEADCFCHFGTAAEAAVEAQNMMKDFNGVHICCMTKAQIDEYIKHDNLRKAWKV